MRSYHSDLGELRSVHRPAIFHLWAWLGLALCPLALFLFGAFLTLDAFASVSTPSREKTAETVSNSLACLGVSGLLLAVLGSIWISDYRAWSATRTVKLRIYQNGFVYESQGHIEACRWNEIADIRFRFIPSYSKAFPGSKVRVIRAIETRGGTTINFAETLDLKRITALITTAKKEL